MIIATQRFPLGISALRLQKQPDGRYAVLNREYKPVGFCTRKYVTYEEYPVLVKPAALLIDVKCLFVQEYDSICVSLAMLPVWAVNLFSIGRYCACGQKPRIYVPMHRDRCAIEFSARSCGASRGLTDGPSCKGRRSTSKNTRALISGEAFVAGAKARSSSPRFTATSTPVVRRWDAFARFEATVSATWSRRWRRRSSNLTVDEVVATASVGR